METYEHNLVYSHELKYSQDAPPDYSLYFNYMDYTFNVKVSPSCEDGGEYTARYYWNEELAGVLRFKYSLINGINKPIQQKVLLLVDAACDKLIGHIIIDLKLREDKLIEMSNALQLHATRKVRDYVTGLGQGEQTQ
jgi:hypothetical protein